MLPCFAHTQGNANTANTFSDRMSMVSGTNHGEPHSDTEMISMGGGPPSEAGSTIVETMSNIQAAKDEKRELDQLFRELLSHMRKVKYRTMHSDMTAEDAAKRASNQANTAAGGP